MSSGSPFGPPPGQNPPGNNPFQDLPPQQQYNPNPYQPGQFPTAAPQENNLAVRMLIPIDRSIWAIAAGYLGLFSLCALPAPLAILCGVMGLREIKRNPKVHGAGRCYFGIVMGTLGSLFLVLWLILMVASALTADPR